MNGAHFARLLLRSARNCSAPPQRPASGRCSSARKPPGGAQLLPPKHVECGPYVVDLNILGGTSKSFSRHPSFQKTIRTPGETAGFGKERCLKRMENPPLETSQGKAFFGPGRPGRSRAGAGPEPGRSRAGGPESQPGRSRARVRPGRKREPGPGRSRARAERSERQSRAGAGPEPGRSRARVRAGRKREPGPGRSRARAERSERQSRAGAGPEGRSHGRAGAGPESDRAGSGSRGRAGPEPGQSGAE